jgi:hypothetical protein
MTAWIKMAGCGCTAALVISGMVNRTETAGPATPGHLPVPAVARQAPLAPALPRRAHLVRLADSEPAEASDTAPAAHLRPASGAALIGLGLLAAALVMALRSRRPSAILAA